MTSPEKKQVRERALAEDLAQAASEMAQETAMMIGEVTKVLHTQRWQVQEGPFTGFGSPPGRF